MKKLIAFAAVLALPLGVFAQGTVVFANSTSPDSRFTTNGVANGYLTGVNQFLIGLYTAPAGTTDESSFILRITATNQTSPARGLFSGGNPAIVQGIPINTTVAFQIRAWSFVNGGPTDTYENAGPNAYKGKSAIGSVTGGDPLPGGSSPGALFGTGAGQVLGVNLNSVPEPSSIALGLLGLGAIALFRRRK